MTDQPNSNPESGTVPGLLPMASLPRRVGADVRPIDIQLGQQPQDSSTLSLAFVWHVVQRRWPIAVPIGVLLTAVAMGVVWLLFEPRYRAEQWLQIRRERPVVVQKLAQEDTQLYVETQVELMRSPLILGKILAEQDIAAMPEVRREEDPLKWLTKQLQVRPAGKSELFSVAFEGPNRANAELIVDAIVKTFFELHDNASDKETKQLLQVLEEEKVRQEEEVKRLQVKVQATAKAAAGGAAVVLDGQGRAVLDLNPVLNLLHQRLIDAQVDAQLLKAKISVQEGSSATAVEPQFSGDIDSHPQIAALREAIDNDQASLVVLLKGTDGYRQREQRIASGEARLVEARADLQKQLSNRHAAGAVFSRQQKLDGLKEQLREYEEREKHLRDRLDQERQQMEARNGGSFALEFVQNELLRAKEVAQKIEDRIFWLRIELVPLQRPERIIQHQLHAVASSAPIEAIPYKKLAMAGFVAFCLPFGLFGAWDHMTQRIYQPQQLRNDSLVPLIGEVAVMPSRPLLPSPGSRRRYEQERALFEESVESLRTALAVSDRLQGLQILVIASAISGEGKTSLASQLAVSWARGGSGPVLIIDADLRRPSLHEVLGVKAGPGLAELLRGECQVADAVVDWGHDVHVLPAGKLNRNPHRLFSGPDFVTLLQNFRGAYSRIIVDVPPILSAGETLHLAKAADGVLLCVMKDHSRASQVKLAYERLTMAGANTIGAVLSGVSSHDYAYRYGEYST